MRSWRRRFADSAIYQEIFDEIVLQAMGRDGKPKGFFHLDHRTVDAKHAVITDTHVTPANVHDSQPYLARLDRQSERFNFNLYAVGLDAGYFTPTVCKGLEDHPIAGVMGYRRPTHNHQPCGLPRVPHGPGFTHE